MSQVRVTMASSGSNVVLVVLSAEADPEFGFQFERLSPITSICGHSQIGSDPLGQRVVGGNEAHRLQSHPLSRSLHLPIRTSPTPLLDNACDKMVYALVSL